MEAAHSLSPCLNLLPELPFRKEAAADYVIRTGLCKDVAGPGGPGGTGQLPQPLLPAPSTNLWSGARLLPQAAQVPPPPGLRTAAQLQQETQGEAVVRPEAALVGESGILAWGPSSLMNWTNVFPSLGLSFPFWKTKQEACGGERGLGNLQRPSHF